MPNSFRQTVKCHEDAHAEVQAARALLARPRHGPCGEQGCTTCSAMGHVQHAFTIMTRSPLVIGGDFHVLQALHQAFADIKNHDVVHAEECLEEAARLLERFRAA